MGSLADGAGDEMDQAREVVSKTSTRIRGSSDNIRSTFDLMGIPHPRFVNPFMNGAPFRIKLRTHISLILLYNLHGGGSLSHYLEAIWEIAISIDSRKGIPSLKIRRMERLSIRI